MKLKRLYRMMQPLSVFSTFAFEYLYGRYFMTFILTILLLCVCAEAKCQSPEDALADNATGYAMRNKYDSALYFFLLLNKNYPEHESAFILSRLGDCYRMLGDEKSAEIYFLKCLATANSSNAALSSKSLSSLLLSDMYRKQQDFSKALYYYNASASKYRVRGLFCGNSLRFNRYRLAIRKAACFSGLEKYDSVAKLLLPYMFQDYANSYVGDTLFVDSLSQVYANAVVKAYGKELAKKKLVQSMDNLLYQISDKTPNTIVINCTFEYFGKLSILKDEQVDNDLIETLKLTKQQILDEIMCSPAYRLIMYDDCLIPLNSPL